METLRTLSVRMHGRCKSAGLHPLRIVLHPEVSVTVTANIAQSAEEAELRAKGIDPMRLRDADEAEGGAIEPPAAAIQAAPR